EGRPRRADVDRALEGEVRDAVWMLTKQWPIGEFEAEDAGSPVSTKVRMRTAPLTKYEPAGSAAEAFTEDVPLEAKVERRTLRWVVDGHKVHLDLRAELGRQWGGLLDDAGLHAYRDRYRIKYPFELPTPGRASDYVYAHRQAWQQYAALAGRAIDGGELHLYLAEDPGHHASDGIALDAPTDGQKLDDLGKAFEEWLAALYYQPEAEAAWKPPYLEYQFACAGPDRAGGQALAADEYASGHLDWYSFDLRAQGIGATGDPGEVAALSTFLPTPVTFQGMPDARWWALEDRKTDFGSIKPSTTDVAQLLLMEFALVYADDWFLVPFRLPGGTLAHVDGAAVATTFGERLACGGGPAEPYRGEVAYLAMTDVPEPFIPLVPVHVPGSIREVQLQRSRMLRIIEGDPQPPVKIPPRTTLMREGLDEAQKKP